MCGMFVAHLSRVPNNSAMKVAIISCEPAHDRMHHVCVQLSPDILGECAADFDSAPNLSRTLRAPHLLKVPSQPTPPPGISTSTCVLSLYNRSAR